MRKQTMWQDTPFIDFNAIILPKSPNYCLAGLNCHGKQKITVPIFNVSVQQLKIAWANMLKHEPRIKVLKTQPEQQQLVQRSRIFRFPDLIDVQFIAVDHTQSTLAIFSRSIYGHSDFGVNCDRVKRWLNNLQNMIDAD